MNTPNIILAAKANSGKSTNNVWVVYTSADTANKMYCTSAYKAMRLAFLLKKRLGIGISENSFAIAAALGIAQASLALLSFARYLPRTPVARDCTHQGSHGCPSAAGGEARAAAHARKAQEERAQAKGRKGGLGRASTSARLERVGLSSVATARAQQVRICLRSLQKPSALRAERGREVMMFIIPFPIGKAEFPRASSFPKAMSHVIFAKNKSHNDKHPVHTAPIHLHLLAPHVHLHHHRRIRP